MAGRITKVEQQLEPDPRFEDKALALINCMMKGGNKATAIRVVYRAGRDPEADRQGEERGAPEDLHRTVPPAPIVSDLRRGPFEASRWCEPRSPSGQPSSSAVDDLPVDHHRRARGEGQARPPAPGEGTRRRAWRGQGRHHPREHPPHGRGQQGLRALRLVSPPAAVRGPHETETEIGRAPHSASDAKPPPSGSGACSFDTPGR